MHFKKLLPLTLGALALAQSLTNAIAVNNASLSALSSLLSAQTVIVSALTSATNTTVLDPSNDTLSKFLNSSAGLMAASMSDVVSALLTYHVLNGTYLASAFSSTPMFIPTLLTNTSYTSITGGQRVEAMTNGSNVVFTSGLLSTSMVTTANVNFTSGVLHIIDTILTIPQSDSAAAVAAGLSSLPAPQQTRASSSQSTHGAEQHHSETVAGGNVTIAIEDGSVFVNSAKVVTPNVLVANGVVHVIDGVLNPNNIMATPNPTASTQSVAFGGASSASSAPFTSGVTAPSTTISSTTISSTTISSTTISSTTTGANSGLNTSRKSTFQVLGF